MRHLFAISLLTLFSLFANSQGWMWAKHFNGTGQNMPMNSIQDKQGNNYIYGNFNGTVNQETLTLVSAGLQDIFISKYDKNGQIVWLKAISGTATESAVNIVLSNDGNYFYVSGTTNGTTNFDGNLISSAGGLDVFIAKYSVDGTLIWTHNSVSGAGNQGNGNIMIDASGNIVQLGTFISVATFYGGTTLSDASGIRQNFLAKYDPNGNLLWAKQIQDDNVSTFAKTISVCSNGYFISGNYQGNLLLDVGTITSSGLNDGFLYKTDLNGNGIFLRKIEGNGDDIIWKHTSDNNDNQYLTGYFNSVRLKIDSTGVDTSKRVLNNVGSGTNDLFVIKYNSSGILQWVRTAGTSGNDYSYNIDVTNTDVILTGSFSGLISFDNFSLTNLGASDAFVAECNSSGQFINAVKAAGKTDDYGKAIKYSSTGRNFVASGEFYSDTLTIGQNIFVNSSSLRDAYIVRFGCFDSLNFQITPVSCIDGMGIPLVDDGAVTVTPSEGSDPYTYQWSNGATTSTISNLGLGVFNVTVSGSNGCILTGSATVSYKPLLQASITNIFNITCNGASTGSATVTASLGNSPYTYNWSNNATTATISNVVAGTYTVTVTDQCQNTVVCSAVITQPSVLKANISTQTDISCNGGSNGSATVTASGGTGPYTYLWNDPAAQTTATCTALTAGTWDVTVTDQCQNTVVGSVVITQPDVLTANITAQTNVSCNGGSNGSATVTAGGGTAPYTYLWNDPVPAQTAPTCTALTPGTWSVTVTDANFCTEMTSVVITQPAVLTSSITAQANVACNGGATGSATVTAAGGTAPYSYVWNDPAPAQTTATCTGLTVGIWTVTVTSIGGCTATSSVTITQPGLLTSSITAQTNISCNGGSSGSATVTAGGGTLPYTYLWNDPAPAQTTSTCTGLTVGTWNVTVTDANLCSTISTVTITQPTNVIASIVSQTNVSCNGGSNGKATAKAVGGSNPTTYLWNDPAPAQTTATCTNLTAGIWSVTVTRTGGCAVASVTITEPPVLAASITSVTNVSCRNGSDGSATVTASGGTPSYTYLWNDPAPAQTTSTCTGLTAGTWNVTITDANLCTAITSATVTQPAALSVINVIVKTSPCINTGKVTANPSNGTAPYTYLWSNGATTQTISNLASGTYRVTVTDACGATVIKKSVVGKKSIIITTVTTCSSPSCTGTATANVTGGDAPYTYLWSDGQTTQTATNLCSGTYIVTVTDVNGCTKRRTNISVGACFKSTVKGASGEFDSDKISIYPNPVSTQLFILIDNEEKPGESSVISMEIYNLLGELISTEEKQILYGDLITKDVTTYPPGIYMVTVTDGEERFTQRIIVQ